MRIGFDERLKAATALQEHLVAGRITQAEFNERKATIDRASIVADLDPVFADLPGGVPTSIGGPSSTAWPTSTGSTAAPQPQTQQWPTLPLGGTPGYATTPTATTPTATPQPSAQPDDPYADNTRSFEHQQLEVRPDTSPARAPRPQDTPSRRIGLFLAQLGWPAMIVLMFVTRSVWPLLFAIFVMPALIRLLTGEDKGRSRRG